MSEQRVTWLPCTNSERTAWSKFGAWATMCWTITLAAGRLKGKKCMMIWPVNSPLEGRWISLEQIENIV